jgi:hypothetical protein
MGPLCDESVAAWSMGRFDYRLPSRLGARMRARMRASHGYTIRRAIRTSRSHFIGTSVNLEPDRPKSD